MEIGDILYINFDIGENDHEQYRCKVMDKSSERLFIDLPTHAQTLKTAYIPIHKPFYVTYQKNENVFRFRSYIIQRQNQSVPKLIIHLPPKIEHERIQRREHVRVEVAIDVAVHCKNNSFSPFTTVTNDISGGGLSIYVNKEIFDHNIPIKLGIVLQMDSGEFNYIFTEAHFIRYKQIGDNGVKTASLKYHNISGVDRQQIIMYCFEKQREERKKEYIFIDK